MPSTLAFRHCHPPHSSITFSPIHSFLLPLFQALEAERAAGMATTAPPLTQAEIDERKHLIESAPFKHWPRHAYQAFLRGLERHGRTNLEAVARDVCAVDEEKTEEDVRAYAAAFWERSSQLDDGERAVRAIVRGEQRLKRSLDVMRAVARKVERYARPLDELHISYGPQRGRHYTEDEDRFLLCAVHELGYGRWEEVKAAVRASWRFRFDWFIKSRTPAELGRRADTLIKLIEKEQEDEGGDAGSKRGRVSGAEEPVAKRPSGAVVAGG